MRVVTSEAYRGQCPFQEVDARPGRSRRDAPIRVENIRAALRLDGGYAFAEPGAYGDEPILAVHDARDARLARPRLGGLVARRPRAAGLPVHVALDRLMGSAGGPPRVPARSEPAGGYCVRWIPRRHRRGDDHRLPRRGRHRAHGRRLRARRRRRRGRALPAAWDTMPGPTTSAVIALSTTPPSRCAMPRRAGATRVAVHRRRLPPRQRHAGDLLHDPSPCWSRTVHADPDFEFPVVAAAPTSAAAGRERTPALNVPLPAGTTDDQPTWRRSRARRGRRGPSRGSRGRLARRGRLPRRPDRLLRAHDRGLRAHRPAG